MRKERHTVKNLILAHAVWVPVAAKADDNEALLLGEDCLVDMPAGDQMRKDDRTHNEVVVSAKKSDLCRDRSDVEMFVVELLRCLKTSQRGCG